MGHPPSAPHGDMGNPPSVPHRKPQPRETSQVRQLLTSVLCDVAHPGQRLVAALLDDLQVAHLDTKALSVPHPCYRPSSKGQGQGAGRAQQEGLSEVVKSQLFQGTRMHPAPIHLLRGSKEIDPMSGLGFGVSAVTLGSSVPGSQPWHSYLDARGSEVGDLELDTDGRFALLVFGLYTGKTKVGPHEVLLATLGRKRKGLLGSCPAVRPTTKVLSPRSQNWAGCEGAPPAPREREARLATVGKGAWENSEGGVVHSTVLLLSLRTCKINEKRSRQNDSAEPWVGSGYQEPSNNLEVI